MGRFRTLLVLEFGGFLQAYFATWEELHTVRLEMSNCFFVIDFKIRKEIFGLEVCCI